MLPALRHEFQRAQKNTSSAFKARALKIVRQEMAAKDWQDQWVGKLEEACSQLWAKELGLRGRQKNPSSAASGQTQVAGSLRSPAERSLRKLNDQESLVDEEALAEEEKNLRGILT